MWNDECIDGGVQCFGHVERMENDKIANMIYGGKWVGSCSLGRPLKSWIDTMKNCLKYSFGCQASKENGV